MKNSIEEDIKILEEFKTNGYNVLLMKYGDRIKTNFKLAKAIEHILSDYKRILKENKSLQKTYDDCYCKYKHYKQFESISVQKIKDKIGTLEKVKENNIKRNFDTVYKDGYFTGGIDSLQELLEKEK